MSHRCAVLRCAVLCSAVLQVGHFWLTPGLAFAPRSGSALYIDVRLVSHCSDPCVVTNGGSMLEGRCALAASGSLHYVPPVILFSTELRQTAAARWRAGAQHGCLTGCYNPLLGYLEQLC
jgi:hypothetical protein